MNFGNGGAVANVENLDGRLLQANVGKPMESTYTYDPDGRPASVSIPATPWFNRDFAYDEHGRLISATGPFGVKGYTWFDSGNRHIESRDASLTASGGEVALSFTYNQLNELAKVSLPSGATVAEYAYNALGQRVQKTVAPADTKGFLYDFEGNLLCETDSAGAITREYIHRGSARTGFIAGENLYYFHNDTTGNPVLVTDSTKTVVREGIYEPFGKVTVNSHSTIENNLRFQGRYFDAETGFHYNHHRYYDPRTGTYNTPDPIGLAGGINLYVYAGNHPVNNSDPIGLKTIWVPIPVPVPVPIPTPAGPIPAIILFPIPFPITIPDSNPMETRGNADPTWTGNYVPVNPGRDGCGNCRPCPPDSPVWTHTHLDGTTNSHQIIYEQNQETCECFPKRIHL